MVGVDRPSVLAPRLGKLATGWGVAKLVQGLVVRNHFLLPVRVESRLDVVPVVDADSSGVPEWLHFLRLDVEIRVHRLGRDVERDALAVLEFLLHFLRKRDGFAELRPGPVPVALLLDWLVQLRGGPRLAAVDAHVDALNLSAAARPCYALDSDFLRKHKKASRVEGECRIRQAQLNRHFHSPNTSGFVRWIPTYCRSQIWLHTMSSAEGYTQAIALAFPESNGRNQTMSVSTLCSIVLRIRTAHIYPCNQQSFNSTCTMGA